MKRRKTLERKDSVSQHKRIVRLDQKQYQELSEITCANKFQKGMGEPKFAENELGQQMEYLTLRPKPSSSYLQQYMANDESADEYVLVHRQKAAEFWNRVVLEHKKLTPNCCGLVQNDDNRSSKVGTVWSMAAKCSQCGYFSEKVKLYDEVDTGKRGRKAAGPNVRLQVALSKNSIGNTAVQHILTSLNLDPPSKSGLKKCSNKVGDEIIDINIKDMRDLRGHIKKVNIMAGRPEGLLDAEADATYNHRLGSAELTPTQPATQATYLFVENVTSAKKIINCKTYSRLCMCDIQEKEGPHTQKCKANLAVNAVIGNEKLYLAQTLAELYDEDFSVQFMTIDGDSSARSLLDGLEQPNSAIECKVQYCTRHLNRLFMKKVQAENFSPEMFPGKTKAEKTEIQKLFAMDIAKRAQAEYNLIFIQYGHSVEEMIKHSSYIPGAIIACYQGCCPRYCWPRSFVCSKGFPWQRTYLATKYMEMKIIRPTLEDRKKLRQHLDIRFSRKAVIMTQTNSTQNKCEASNRGLTKAVPKNQTYRRNYAGRIHSAVHSMNHSPGESTVIIADKLGARFPGRSPAVKALRKMDQDRIYNQEYKKSEAARTARKHRRETNFRQCYQRKAEGYNKGAAIVEDLYQPTASTSDHRYNRQKRHRRLTIS